MTLLVKVKFKGIYLPGYKPDTTPSLPLGMRKLSIVPAGTEWSRYKFFLSNQAENDLVVGGDVGNKGQLLLHNVDDSFDIVYDYGSKTPLSYTGAAAAAGAGISNLRLSTRGAGYQPHSTTQTLNGAAPDAWAASAGGANAEATVFVNVLGQLWYLTLTKIGNGYTIGADFAIDFSGITHPIGANATGLFDVVAGTQTTITCNGHGLEDGDYVWMSNGSIGSYDGGHYISDVGVNSFVIPVTFGANETGNILAPRQYTYRLKPGEFAYFRSGEGATELYGMADGKNDDDKEERPMCDLICVEE